MSCDIQVSLTEPPLQNLVKLRLTVNGRDAPKLRNVAANFRNILLMDVETFTISTVNIYANDTILVDELMAHRLGQIPLEGWLTQPVGNTVDFHLDITNTMKTEIRTIDSSEILSSSPYVFPISNVIVAKLRPNQRLFFRAQARWGTAREHIRFSMVANPYFEIIDEETNPAAVLTIETLDGISPIPLILKALNVLQAKYSPCEIINVNIQ